MPIISEPKLVNFLWNYLEQKGYTVGGEVKIISAERVKEIKRKRRELEAKLEQPIAESPTKETQLAWIKEFIKRKLPLSEWIDLVATNGSEFVGFEVKNAFDKVSNSLDQLEGYCEGNMLNKVYLVIPHREYEHVEESYGYWFDKKGIGIITLTGEDFQIKKESRTFPRLTKPELKENEAWLKHVLWNYFEAQGFEVEGEGVLPKPNIFEISRGCPKPPQAFIERIDLCMLPKGENSTTVVNNQDRMDHIGIEAKYEVSINRSKGLIDQLNSYADSGALTKVYLAILKGRNLWWEQKSRLGAEE